MTDIDGLLRDHRPSDAYTRALDALNAAVTEVQRLGAVLGNDVTGSLLVPFVAASAAATSVERRAGLDRMLAALPGIAALTQRYATDCTAAIAPPLTAAYAALQQETPMALRTVNLDFAKNYGDEAPREYVRGISCADTVIGQFVAPLNDPKFMLTVQHTNTVPGVVRKTTLKDASGKPVKPEQTWMQPTFRMSTTVPPTPGTLGLAGGQMYSLTVEGVTGDPAQKADFYFGIFS